MSVAALEQTARQVRNEAARAAKPAKSAHARSDPERWLRLFRQADRWMQRLTKAAALPAESEDDVRNLALANLLAYAAAAAEKGGAPAADALLEAWTRAAVSVEPELSRRVKPWLAVHPLAAPVDAETAALFATYLSRFLAESEAILRARTTLHRLMSHLDLSYDDVGRMFSVAGETARRWTNGASTPASEVLARIGTAEAALGDLLQSFTSEALPAVVRRPAALFDGERALDWILRGRLEEVAARYDRALRYS
jgi:hypothetical protein